METIKAGDELRATTSFLNWLKHHGFDDANIAVGDGLQVVDVTKQPEFGRHVVAVKSADDMRYDGVSMKIVKRMRRAFLPPVPAYNHPAKPLPTDIHSGEVDPEDEVFNAAGDDF